MVKLYKSADPIIIKNECPGKLELQTTSKGAKDINVIVYKSSEKMIEAIEKQISIKPTFLQRITN